MSGAVVLRQVFKSSFWQAVAAGWVLFVAFNVWDVARRSWPPSGVVALIALAVASVVVYILSVRCSVVADGAGIEIRNPLRTIHLPWNQITDIDATDALRVHVGDKIYRSWAVSRGGALSSVFRGSGRKSLDATPGVPKDALQELARRSPADYAAGTLVEVWRQVRKQTAGEVRISWAWPEAIVLVALVVVLFIASSTL